MNNIIENINRYLNSQLKRARCSTTLFGESILNLITQFENKSENEALDNKKSDLISFYINRNNNSLNILNNTDFKKIISLYNEIEFTYINKYYIEDNMGDLYNVILPLDSEDEGVY